MGGTSAVIFVPDDTNKTGYSRPLMLSRIMGSPLLSWLVSALIARRYSRRIFGKSAMKVYREEA